jgi:hypothetical protein
VQSALERAYDPDVDIFAITGLQTAPPYAEEPCG